MTKIQTVIASIILSCFIVFVPFVSADDLTMTTYYPAPSGNYQNLTVSTLLTTLNANVTGTLTAANFNPASINATGNIIVGGTLGVTGATTLSNLTVTGTSTLQGNTTVGISGNNASGHLIAYNDATVHGILDLHAITIESSSALTVTGNSSFDGNIIIDPGNLTLNTGGVTLTVGNITLTAGRLTANGGVFTSTLAATGSITGATTLDITGQTRIGNTLAGHPYSEVALLPGTGPGTIALAPYGNIAMVSNWVNSTGASNYGMNFGTKRIGINITAPAANTAPVLLIRWPSNFGSIGDARVSPLLELGARTGYFTNATDATARINGTLAVSDNSTFGGIVKAYKGVTIGDADGSSVTCTPALYGTLSYACLAVTPASCQLKICAPCTTGVPAGCPGNGAQWATIFTSTANGGGSGGGIGMITSDPPID